MRKIITPIIVLLIAFFLVACQIDKLDTELIESKLANIYQEGDSQNSVTKDLNLVTEIEGFENLEITWTSSNTSVTIDGNKGIVKRIQFDVNVTLTAIVTLKDVEYKFTFPIVVLKQSTEDEDFDFDALFAKITLPAETTSNLNLPVTLDGVTLTWVSDNAESITNLGVVTRKTEDVTVKLTVSATVEGVTESKDFTVKVLKKVAVTEVDFAAIFAKIDIPVETDKDIVLPSTIDGAILSWTSDHMDALDATGKVTRQLTDVTVTLNVEALKDGQRQSKTYQIKVLKKVSVPISGETAIVDARKLATGTKVTVEGVVTSSMSNGSYSLQDSTGAIAIYFGSGKNSELVVGRHYIIEGSITDYEGLTQIEKPTIKQNVGEHALPDILDLSKESLALSNIKKYESYIASFNDLEVISTESVSNAFQVKVKNANGETSTIRRDERVNDSTNPLTALVAGDMIHLQNVTVGQFKGSSQLMFTKRSAVIKKPKDTNQPFIQGTKNYTFTIGVDTSIDFLAGITAGTAGGENYLDKLTVDSSKVNYDVAGTYEVTYRLSGISGYDDIVVKVNVVVREQSQPGDYLPYYDSVAHLTGDELFNELHSLLRSTAKIKSYGGSLNPVLIDADKHPTKSGMVYTIYDGAAISASASSSSGASVWNKEHVIPKSWYNTKYGNHEGDVHNLRISRASINSTRGNKKFVDGSGTWNSDFYPGDDHKGDVARIAMYMIVMLPDVLDFNTVMNNGKDVLMRWHMEDPVDDFEIRRNQILYESQGNRNPFIDYPELAQLVFN